MNSFDENNYYYEIKDKKIVHEALELDTFDELMDSIGLDGIYREYYVNKSRIFRYFEIAIEKKLKDRLGSIERKNGIYENEILTVVDLGYDKSNDGRGIVFNNINNKKLERYDFEKVEYNLFMCLDNYGAYGVPTPIQLVDMIVESFLIKLKEVYDGQDSKRSFYLVKNPISFEENGNGNDMLLEYVVRLSVDEIRDKK